MGVLEWIERLGKGLNHHHHAGTSPERCVVDLPMDSLTEGSKIYEVDGHGASLLRPTDEADL